MFIQKEDQQHEHTIVENHGIGMKHTSYTMAHELSNHTELEFICMITL